MAQPEQIPNGRLRGWHFIFLGVLLAPPAAAIYRGFGPTVSGWIGGWCVAASAFTYLIYARDKRLARDQEWREPESLLHFTELAGGWPGAFLAQRRLRHKSSKFSYQFVFWLIVLLHELVAADFLLGWPLLHRLLAAIK